MSGGHFNYEQYKIDQIADEIEELIESNDSTEQDEYGCDIGRHYPAEVIERFGEAVDLLRRSALMVKRIDWLVSGDDGADEFIWRWDDEL